MLPGLPPAGAHTPQGRLSVCLAREDLPSTDLTGISRICLGLSPKRVVGQKQVVRGQECRGPWGGGPGGVVPELPRRCPYNPQPSREGTVPETKGVPPSCPQGALGCSCWVVASPAWAGKSGPPLAGASPLPISTGFLASLPAPLSGHHPVFPSAEYLSCKNT